MNEMIEKMKNNEKPFGLLVPEEQEFMKSLPSQTCEYYTGGRWNRLSDPSFGKPITYRISQDYKPELEIERVAVDMSDENGGIGFSYQEWCWCFIEEAAHHPNFIEYEYEDGETSLYPRLPGKKGRPARDPKYVLFVK